MKPTRPHDPRNHPPACTYHVDQYPHECTCGLLGGHSRKEEPLTTHATLVRAKAAQLVQNHAARLGMDAVAAALLVRTINSIPDPGEAIVGTAFERHNALGQELFAKVVENTKDEAEAFTLLESLTLAVMLLHRPDPRQAGEVLDMMTTQVLERMKP